VPGPITSLEDGDAKIGMVDASLIKHLINLPLLGKIAIRPVVRESVEVDMAAMKIKPCPEKPCTNVAPFVEIVFATCELATNVKIILSGSVVKLLDELGAYGVLKCPADMSKAAVDVVTTLSMAHQDLFLVTGHWSEGSLVRKVNS